LESADICAPGLARKPLQNLALLNFANPSSSTLVNRSTRNVARHTILGRPASTPVLDPTGNTAAPISRSDGPRAFDRRRKLARKATPGRKAFFQKLLVRPGHRVLDN